LSVVQGLSYNLIIKTYSNGAKTKYGLVEIPRGKNKRNNGNSKTSTMFVIKYVLFHLNTTPIHSKYRLYNQLVNESERIVVNLSRLRSENEKKSIGLIHSEREKFISIKKILPLQCQINKIM